MEQNQRNYGIDCLRIVSMLMVLSLHMAGHGGILAAASPNSVNYQLAWLLELLSYGAVNCYVLVSGYVGVNATFRYYKIFYVWLQVFFYSAAIAVVFQCASPPTVDAKELVSYCFPVLSGKYWYFTSYFVLLFMMPLFNTAIRHMTKRQAKALVCSIVILFSLLPSVLRFNFLDMPVGYTDYIGNRNGYCVWWFLLLYVVGGCIAKFGLLQRMKQGALLAVYAGCVLLSWGFKVWGEHSGLPFFQDMISPNLLVSYTSPTVLLASIALLALFAKANPVSDRARRVIGFFAPVSFGVYLIHDHPLVRKYCIEGQLTGLANLPPLSFLFAFIAIVLLVYLLCGLIDEARLLAFRWLRIKQKIECVANCFAEKPHENAQT